MRRRIHAALVVLGLVTLTAGMLAQQRPTTGGGEAPPAAANPLMPPIAIAGQLYSFNRFPIKATRTSVRLAVATSLLHYCCTLGGLWKK